jgi:hypothetical protein
VYCAGAALAVCGGDADFSSRRIDSHGTGGAVNGRSARKSDRATRPINGIASAEGDVAGMCRLRLTSSSISAAYLDRTAAAAICARSAAPTNQDWRFSPGLDVDVTS